MLFEETDYQTVMLVLTRIVPMSVSHWLAPLIYAQGVTLSCPLPPFSNCTIFGTTSHIEKL